MVKTYWIQLIPLAFLVMAAATDARSRKIKNYTTYPMLLTGLLAGYLTSGLEGFNNALIGMLAGGFLIAIIPGYTEKYGDVKLSAACGAWLGQIMSVYFFILISVTIFTLFVAIRLGKQKGFNKVYTQLKCDIQAIITAIRLSGGSIRKLYNLLSELETKKSEGSVPMAPIMLIAYLMTSVWR